MLPINPGNGGSRPTPAVITKKNITGLNGQNLSNPFSFELKGNRLTINFKNPLAKMTPLAGHLVNYQGKPPRLHDDSFEYTTYLSEDKLFEIETEKNIHLVHDGKALKLINKENNEEKVLAQISNLLLARDTKTPDNRTQASQICAS